MVCDGNSITAGSAPGTSYPGQLNDLLFAYQPDRWILVNQGHSGDTMQQLLSEYVANIRPYASGGSYTRRLLIVMEGYNAINGGRTPAQVATDTASYVALAVADGFTVYVGTALLSGDANAANLASYNTLIRSNWASWGATGIIDWETATGLTPAGVTANPASYTDEVHPNTTGYGHMATKAFTTITA